MTRYNFTSLEVLEDAEVDDDPKNQYAGGPSYRFRGPDFSRARGSMRLGNFDEEEVSPPWRYKWGPWNRRGQVRIGASIPDWKEMNEDFNANRVNSAAELGYGAPDRNQDFNRNRIPGASLGSDSTKADKYTGYLSYGLVPEADSCYPMDSNPGLPACPRYSEINDSIDWKGAAEQYIGRFFKVAVTHGMMAPDRSMLQRLFNYSAGLYYTAYRGIQDMSMPKDEVIFMIGESDRNMAFAFRMETDGPPSVRQPEEELEDEQKDVLRPTDTPPGTSKKRSWAPWVAGALAGGLLLFVTAGAKDENEEFVDDQGIPMSGT